MTGLATIVVVTAAAVAATACAAALLVGACLALAAALPHGHAEADRLRAFAGKVPGAIWRTARRLDTLLTLGAVAAAVALTIVMS